VKPLTEIVREFKKAMELLRASDQPEASEAISELAHFDVIVTGWDLDTNVLHGIPWPGNLPPWARKTGQG